MTLCGPPHNRKSGTNILFLLREQLPVTWRDVYLATVAHPANIVRFRFRTFEYICDLNSELEATGEVPYNQTIQDRVVAVLLFAFNLRRWLNRSPLAGVRLTEGRSDPLGRGV